MLKSKDIIEAEMKAIVYCKFSLYIPFEYLEDHFYAFLRMNELELREYLGDERYSIYLKYKDKNDEFEIDEQ